MLTNTASRMLFTAFEQDGLLHLVAGPTNLDAKSEAAFQRYFFPSQSFHLQVEAGLTSQTTLMGSVGLAIANLAYPGDSLTLISLNRRDLNGSVARSERRRKHRSSRRSIRIFLPMICSPSYFSACQTAPP